LICVHCGLCCYDFPVAIIAREFIDKFELIDDFPEEAFIIKEGNTPCTYLHWKNHQSNCEVHNKPWYKNTPCFDFGQIEESPDCVCRIGEWIMKKRKKDNRFDYELKCKTFIKPKSPNELHEIFSKRKETDAK
jgi:hypothetical protein